MRLVEQDIKAVEQSKHSDVFLLLNFTHEDNQQCIGGIHSLSGTGEV